MNITQEYFETNPRTFNKANVQHYCVKKMLLSRVLEGLFKLKYFFGSKRLIYLITRISMCNYTRMLFYR